MNHFSEEELLEGYYGEAQLDAHLAECQEEGGRSSIILLSDRELEPYFVYGRAAKEFEIDSTAISLSDLARTTGQLYFHPKSKSKDS